MKTRDRDDLSGEKTGEELARKLFRQESQPRKCYVSHETYKRLARAYAEGKEDEEDDAKK